MYQAYAMNKRAGILFLLSFFANLLCADGNKIAGTDWVLNAVDTDMVWLLTENVEKNSALFVKKTKSGWAFAVATPHFIYDTALSSGVIITLKSDKPFSLKNRSMRVILEPTKFKKNLFFGWSSNDDPVAWLAGRKSIKVIIPEMGSGHQEFTYNVKGLKTAMLDAEAQQRNL